MQEENNKGIGGTQSLNWWIHLIATTAILVVMSVIIYVYILTYGGFGVITSIFSPSSEPEANITMTFPNLPGGIILSAVVGTDENGIDFVPVMVFPDTNDSVYVPVDQLASGPIFSLQHTLSADSTKLTFLGWPLVENLSHKTPAIYRADIGGEGVTYDEAIQNIQNTAVLVLEPDAEDYFRHGPVVSSASDILYSSLSEAEFDPEPAVYGTISAEEWTIYRIDVDNQRHTLTNGLAPKWIDGERFVFLKNDGIYLYDLGTDEERLVWSLSFTPSLLNAFDVSDDGHLLAISNPEAEVVTIIENQEWDENIPAVILAEVSIKATGVTFSFDNSYLAMLQLVSLDEAGTEGFARMVYYAIKEQGFHNNFVNLNDDAKVLQGLYLTDWK